jgi:hypothetical protein
MTPVKGRVQRDEQQARFEFWSGHQEWLKNESDIWSELPMQTPIS